MTPEWLVEIEIRWPPDGDNAERERLVEAEGRRAGELAEAGMLRRLWRIPGRWANVGLWRAADAAELHAALSSLPLFPRMEVVVRPLCTHPSDPGRGDGGSRSGDAESR
ncbi:MAG: muconolactone Delta-isomerase [Acidimicrobiales bacterium]